MVGRPVKTVPTVAAITRRVASVLVSAPEPVTDTASPWPVMRPATTRFVRICRAVAVVVLAYGLLVLLLAARDIDPSALLWVAIGVGAVLHLAGLAGLWFLPPRSPSRLSPKPGGSGSGTPAERTTARKALLAGDDLDAEARRLVALEVAAGARVPLVVAWVFAMAGPVLITTANTAHPLPWLGAVTAAGAVVLLVVLVLQARAARRLHRAAQRADALPTVDGEEAPYLP